MSFYPRQAPQNQRNIFLFADDRHVFTESEKNNGKANKVSMRRYLVYISPRSACISIVSKQFCWFLFGGDIHKSVVHRHAHFLLSIISVWISFDSRIVRLGFMPRTCIFQPHYPSLPQEIEYITGIGEEYPQMHQYRPNIHHSGHPLPFVCFHSAFDGDESPLLFRNEEVLKSVRWKQKKYRYKNSINSYWLKIR